MTHDGWSAKFERCFTWRQRPQELYVRFGVERRDIDPNTNVSREN